MSTKNPWLDLPKQPPYVLASDEAAVDKFNHSKRKEEHRLRTHLPPLPFQGRLDAPVVLLGLNPGYVPADEGNHTTPAFLAANWANYQNGEKTDYPFFFLDPQFKGDDGQNWWFKRLAHLRSTSKHHGEFTDERLANALLCVQLFPYRSKRFASVSAPSQQYGFELVRAAIKRKALVILLRSRRMWFKAVPELNGYENYFEVHAPLQPVLNKQQLGEEGWERLLAALRAAS